MLRQIKLTQHFPFYGNVCLFGKYWELDIARILAADVKDMCALVVGYTAGSSGINKHFHRIENAASNQIDAAFFLKKLVSSSFVSIVAWRHSGISFEIFAESELLWKIQFVCNFLDTLIRLLKQQLCVCCSDR